VQGIEKESLENLTRYSWPGNVRELQNAIERATILAQGPMLGITDPIFSNPPPMPASASPDGTLDSVQKSYIIEVLTRCDGRIEGRNGAAAMLNLKPSTLRYRMRKLGIEKAATR
jgi:formate hydrogenlyase transcriptional activator